MIFHRFFNVLGNVTFGKTICFIIIFTLTIYISFYRNELTKENIYIDEFSESENDIEYSFLVAGHTYGSHQHSNKGIYPKFLHRVHEEIIDKDAFVLFTGDIVRNSTTESWKIVEEQLKKIPIPSFLTMGNHDISEAGLDFFNKKHGNSFYYFSKGDDLFFSFNVNLSWGKITEEQIILFKEALNAFKARNIFIFFHELIWVQDKFRYLHIRHNWGTYRFESNFWDDVFPVLRSFPNRQFYLLAGDVGGTPVSISAFYDKKQNVTFLASGMGETKEENFMRILVKQKSTEIELIPLNNEISLDHITNYGVFEHFLKMLQNQKKYLFEIYKREFFNFIIQDNPN